MKNSAIANLVLAWIVLVATPVAAQAPPPLGSYDWAVEVVKARNDLDAECPSGQELLRRHDRLNALYEGAPDVQKALALTVASRLRQYETHEEFARRLERFALRDQPDTLATRLVEWERFEEARSLCADSLESTPFGEKRTRFLEACYEAHLRLRDLEAARTFSRRWFDETPVDGVYCTRALSWWRRLGEPSVSLSNDPELLPENLEVIDGLLRDRGAEPFVACLASNQLERLGHYISSERARKQPFDPRLLARVPRGVSRAQEELAARTTDPRVQAAILLRAAQQAVAVDQRSRLEALRLARKALDLGTLLSESEALGEHRENIAAGAGLAVLRYGLAGQDPFTDEFRASTIAYVDRFSNWDTSCAACGETWERLFGGPSLVVEIPEWWKRACWSKLRTCSGSHDISQTMARRVDDQPLVSLHEEILAADPPWELESRLRVGLGRVLCAQEPAKAWTIERSAARDPRMLISPVANSRFFTDAQQCAEVNGDFESAAYVAVLHTPNLTGCWLPGERESRHRADTFRLAYYRLRMGIDRSAQWSVMLEQVPSMPEGGWFHGSDYLDRLAIAARIVGQQQSLARWMLELADRYRDVMAADAEQRSPLRRQTELMLRGYAVELDP